MQEAREQTMGGRAGEMAQNGAGPVAGTPGQGISPREIPSPPCGPMEANPEIVCVYCRRLLRQRRRGRPGKFHPACRREFDRQARRLGAKVLRGRLQAMARPRVARFRLSAQEARSMAFLIAAGAMVSGIEIPDLAR